MIQPDKANKKKKTEAAAQEFSPNQLHIKISRMILSHQHSLKFGSMWRKVN
jgi:hypothetical protein